MSEPYLGQIQSFAFAFNPRGWALCAGQQMNVQQNAALFALLGTYYGGNGSTTFNLPDLQGRVAIGQGQGPGLQNYPIGQKSGVASAAMTVAQMPAHSHTFTGSTGGLSLKASSQNGVQSVPGSGTPPAYTLGSAVDDAGSLSIFLYTDAAPDITLNTGSSGGGGGTGSIGNTGGSQPISLMQPVLAINYCIATMGIFPTRD
jgi:microcystin-dependent protein